MHVISMILYDCIGASKVGVLADVLTNPLRLDKAYLIRIIVLNLKYSYDEDQHHFELSSVRRGNTGIEDLLLQ